MKTRIFDLIFAQKLNCKNMIYYGMKTHVFLIAALLAAMLTQAQNKKDLLYEIGNLKSELTETKTALAEAKKIEKASLAEAEAHKVQALELQKINASLMQNLNSFTEASAQRSDNIGRTLETLKVKEAQLKAITDEFSRNDSIALLVLTNFKQTLGEDANIGVENGAVSTLLSPNLLFGSNANSFALQATAEQPLEQIAKVIKANPDTAIAIETQSTGTDGLDLAARRASAVAQSLITTHGIAPERITAFGKIGASQTTFIRIHPKFDAFYFKVRENLKK
ncbi:OmpA family protein [Arenibacter sp. GZD96]|uniref:OmpA family protein n=1 Tax=Aurantibrevibacter litoralis TaxID=3106030 RepID=UPI002AFF8D02|nr:OmpA family protein [Arenibacter sp. GZD-96]MEA1785262.1 OmpA family protein [Arenibacter sp. GZD-96]